jgi:hypothetical protein
MSSSVVRPDLLGTRIEFIVVLLAWCAVAFQLAFEQVTQQPEELLTIGRGQSLPPTDSLTGIGWGGAVLGERLDMGYRPPHAVKLGLAAGAQPR